MAQPYVGEIRMFAGNFAPAGWEFCDGQLLSIADNETLFMLIGTTYGGDGMFTFGLPDLRGRIPLHRGQGTGLTNRVFAEQGGTEQATLLVANLPSHAHALVGSASTADARTPAGNVPAARKHDLAYATPGALAQMNAQAVGSTGSGLAHNNMQPYLSISFIISLFGIFPSM